jgi:hypothetical protein
MDPFLKGLQKIMRMEGKSHDVRKNKQIVGVLQDTRSQSNNLLERTCNLFTVSFRLNKDKMTRSVLSKETNNRLPL